MTSETQWQLMETAPLDRLVLVWGVLDPHPDFRHLYGAELRPRLFTAYWDEIDQAWCINGATWLGPWVTALAWQPLPPMPAQEIDHVK
jgi:hypothetical protein